MLRLARIVVPLLVAVLFTACTSRPANERATTATPPASPTTALLLAPSPPPAPDLSRFRRTVFEGSELPFDRGVTSLTIASDSTLWATGVVLADRPGHPDNSETIVASRFGEWTIHDRVNGFGFEATGSVTVARDLTAWVPAGHGIVRFDSAGTSHLRQLPDLIWSIAVATDGSVWAGGRTIMHIVGGEVTRFEGADAPVEKGWPQDIVVGSDGTVWAGFPTVWGLPSQPGHLARFEGDGWTVLTEEDGVPGDGLRELLATPDGSLWALVEHVEQHGSTSTHLPSELARFDGESWDTFGRSDGLPGWEVLSLAAAADGTVWAGTRRGLVAYDGRGWKAYRIGSVRTVAVAHDGTIWIAQKRALVRLTPPG